MTDMPYLSLSLGMLMACTCVLKTSLSGRSFKLSSRALIPKRGNGEVRPVVEA